MFPELIKIGPLSIKTYGVFVAIGFISALIYCSKRAQEKGYSKELVLDILLYIMISGIAGARITYVLQNWEFYRSNLVEIFYIWSGGLVLYGGIILATTVGIIYLRVKKQEVFCFADFAAPAIFLGVFFGRIGCFFAGCCYGKPCDLPWAVTFKNTAGLAPLNVALHPTQIYEALFCGLLFAWLHFLDKKKKSYNLVDGSIFFASLIAYGIWRFFIEFLRGDDRGPKIIGLFPSQFFSLLVVLVSIGVSYYLWQKKPGKSE